MIRVRMSIKVTKRALERHVALRTIRHFSRFLLAVAFAALPSLAFAEIAWHRDYAAARAASAATGKPVFALFVATWDDEPSAAVFANAEVEAVIAACFEPVRIDVDKEADLISELAIERVPSVAVIGDQGASVSRFDCPATPTEFVAAAARAAQVSAASVTPRVEAGQAKAVAVSPLGGSLEAAPGMDDSSVVDKVRQLSSFAEGKASPPRDPNRFQVAHQQGDASAQPVYGGSAYGQQPSPQSAYVSAALATASPVEAALPRTPPTWQPEQPAAAAYAEFQPAPQSAAPQSYASHNQYPAASQSAPGEPSAAAPSSIEPAATSTNPWLAGAPGGASDAEPESSATASDDGVNKKAAPSGFMASVQRSMNPLAWWPSKPAVEPPPKMPPARSQSTGLFASQPAVVPPSTAASMTPPADPYGSMPLGLEGYCPVTVAERSAWVEGRAQWGIRHRGRTYLFAGPEQQQAFMANPDRYAPALSGDDPVLAFEAGRSEPGQRSLGVSYGTRMYLFSSPDTRAAFSADPTRYTTRVQIAEGLAPADSSRRF